ncbi:MAG: hypothetical protein R3B49_00715 [Phycisphaerales bacterium]
MSTVSGVGTNQSWLLQQLQNSQSSQGVSGAGARPEGPPPGPPPEVQEAIESAAEDAGLDSSQIADLRAQIEEAVAAARESGEGPEAVKSAVDGVLEDAGIDVEALNAQLSGMKGPPPPPSEDYQGASSSAALDALFGDSEETDASSTLLEMLRNLPSGSLYDVEA